MGVRVVKSENTKSSFKAKQGDSGLRRDNTLTLETIHKARAGVEVEKIESLDDFFKDFLKK